MRDEFLKNDVFALDFSALEFVFGQFGLQFGGGQQFFQYPLQQSFLFQVRPDASRRAFTRKGIF